MTSCMLSWFLFYLYSSSFFSAWLTLFIPPDISFILIIYTHIYDMQYIIDIIMEYLSTYKYIIFYIYTDIHKLEDWEILRYYIQMFSFEEDECRVKIQCISGQKTRVNQTEIKASSMYYFKTSLCFLYII